MKEKKSERGLEGKRGRAKEQKRERAKEQKSKRAKERMPNPVQERGARYTLIMLDEKQKRIGVIAASAGKSFPLTLNLPV